MNIMHTLEQLDEAIWESIEAADHEKRASLYTIAFKVIMMQTDDDVEEIR